MAIHYRHIFIYNISAIHHTIWYCKTATYFQTNSVSKKCTLKKQNTNRESVVAIISQNAFIFIHYHCFSVVQETKHYTSDLISHHIALAKCFMQVESIKWEMCFTTPPDLKLWIIHQDVWPYLVFQEVLEFLQVRYEWVGDDIVQRAGGRRAHGERCFVRFLWLINQLGQPTAFQQASCRPALPCHHTLIHWLIDRKN